ncbi:hypothetical protein CBI38_33765 (plasmid) [Rhodococcus oxybenzonivorans]|uniref:Uncharacterized protein n=1 Tax=Rhodococcus oxybenzonivorans TaxID=1990687 RepID=A0A2S2C753_9NOCA|nr:hypothetical protein CBI38_33765 [Rhodococcus oxybenzonivorans]
MEPDRPTPVAAVCRRGRAVARAAMEGDRMFGAVEVTLEKLAELLERHILPVTRMLRRTDFVSRGSSGAL